MYGKEAYKQTSMSQIQQVKDASNIIEIINERVPLTRSGANFRACCPFHSEKTPSFFVSEALQRYRCFGCGASGDVLGFLEQYESMTFAEALQYLAERANIALQDYHRSSIDDERDRLLAVLNLAKEYYHYVLTQHEAGEAARAYLKQRRVTSQSVKIFQMGYALPGWDGLVRYLHGKKKYSLSDLEKAGLVVKGKTGRYYDRFRDRVIFPLKNHRGQVVGFSGRTLSADVKEAKYINSPETMLYHKSEMLYGFSELSQAIRMKKKVMVMEGEFDVISSAQAHVNNVVAIKGSALTEQQAKLLSRSVEQVILALDADEAGINATLKAIEVVQKHNLELRVIDFAVKERAGQKDADEIARENPRLWRELAEQTTSVYEFLLQAAVRKFAVDAPEGKRQVIDFLAPVYSAMTHEVERDYYIQKLATTLSTSVESVRTDIQRFRFGIGKRVNRGTTTTATREKKLVLSRQAQLEQALLALCLHDADTRLVRAQQLLELNLITHSAKAILKRIVAAPQISDFKALTADWPTDLIATVFDLLYDPQTILSQGKESDWSFLLAQLKQEIIHTELRDLNTQIAQLDAMGNRTPEQEQLLSSLLQKIVMLRAKSQV